VDAVWRAICRVRGSDVVRDPLQLLPLHSVGSARRAQEVESIASYLHKNACVPPMTISKNAAVTHSIPRWGMQIETV